MFFDDQQNHRHASVTTLLDGAFGGHRVDFARRIGVSTQTIDNMVSRRTRVTDAMAARIETGVGLQPGSLDLGTPKFLTKAQAVTSPQPTAPPPKPPKPQPTTGAVAELRAAIRVEQRIINESRARLRKLRGAIAILEGK